MRVFVTGATGFIGSAVVRELLSHGHEVLGLTRSDAGAEKLRAQGATPYRGTIDEPDTLRAGAADSDGVIHTAFDHSNMADLITAARKDAAVVEAIGETLAGSGKPFVGTNGTMPTPTGALLTEDFRPDPPQGRSLVEVQLLKLAEQDIRAVSVRPANTVHGVGDHGFIPYLVSVARQKGFSAYTGDGQTRWPSVHVDDAAALYRLAFEKAPATSVVHAVADEGVAGREIAEAIGQGLGLPVRSVAADQAVEHFGWIGPIFGLDIAASSEITRNLVGWQPVGPSLLEEIGSGTYFAS